MHFRIQIVAVSDDGTERLHEIADVSRSEPTLETLGLTLEESKQLLQRLYATPTTVRVRLPDGKERTVPQEQTTALPDGDEATWERLRSSYHTFETVLTELGRALRALGHYPERLRAACAVGERDTVDERALRAAPNPLTSTVVVAPIPPDVSHARPGMVWQPWSVPQVRREAVSRHTPKQLVFRNTDGAEGTHSGQSGTFCCADDAAWKEVAALVDAVELAAAAMELVLGELGTFAAARQRAAAAGTRLADANEQEVTRPDASTPGAVGVDGLLDGLTPDQDDSSEDTFDAGRESE